MQKHYLLLSLLWLVNSLSVPAQTGTPVAELRSVDEAVINFMNRWNIPGGSVAITKDRRLVYARGFGLANQATRQEVKPDHRFRIASLTKPITSLAVLKLVEQGKLDIDAHVFGPAGLLNEPLFTTIQDPRIMDITVRQLLQHTAGWDRVQSGDPMFDPVHIAQAMNRPPPADPTTIIRYMLGQPLDFNPGSRYAYSNFGYCVLGRVIEKITGVAYATYVKASLLDPAGIKSLDLGRNLFNKQLPNEVVYYPASGEPDVPSVYGTNQLVAEMYGGFNLEAMDSHGGWVASAMDLARLLVAMEGFQNVAPLLTPATIDLMASTPPQIASNYAMGWQTNQYNNWWHTGALPGSSTLMARTSSGYTWTVLFNQCPSDSTYFAALDQLIWQGLAGVTIWPSHDLFRSDTTISSNQSITSTLAAPATSIRLYPNPIARELSVEIAVQAASPVLIRLYNQAGQLLKNFNLQKTWGSWKQQLPLNDVSDGLYLVRVTTSWGITQNKIVKTANSP